MGLLAMMVTDMRVTDTRVMDILVTDTRDMVIQHWFDGLPAPFANAEETLG